jgi:hypothetical protein
MTCQRCHKHWCWVCNRKCTDHSWHFDDGNIFGCPGMQFSDSYGFCRRFCLYNMRLAVVCLGLPTVLPFLPVGIVTGLLLLPFGCCCCREDDWWGGEDFWWKLGCLCLWPLALVLFFLCASVAVATFATIGILLTLFCAPFRGWLRDAEWEDFLYHLRNIIIMIVTLD